MTAAPPKVTVIIPTYNRASYLAIALQSVLDGCYDNLQLIVVDDASADDTPQLVSAFQSRNPGRITYLRNAVNSGESASINRGWREATGEYVATLSDDDFFLPNWFECSTAFMDAHPHLIAAYPNWHVVDALGRICKDIRMPRYSFPRLFATCANAPGPGVIIRKSLLANVQQLRDPRYTYSPDYAMWLTLATKGPFAHIPAFTACWRRHEHSLSVSAEAARKAEEMEGMIQEFVAQHAADPLVRRHAKKLQVRAYLHIVYVLCRSRNFRLAGRYGFRAFLLSPVRVCLLAGCYLSRIVGAVWHRLVNKRNHTE